MRKTLRKFIKKLINQPLISFFRNYSCIPRLLFNHLIHLCGMIYFRQRYFNDPEVLLAAGRTNAHILDKSLQADNWEIGHGKMQYETLCQCVDQLKSSSLTSDPSFRWIIEKKQEFEDSQQNRPKESQLHLFNCTGISKSQFLQLIRGRRSNRLFKENQIEPDILKDFADVVSWSATSCNRQSSKLFVTQNSEKITTCLQQCAGATCLGKIIPCFVAVCADLRFYSPQDYCLPFIDASLGLQNMLLLAHLQGIEGVPLNWMHHTYREEKILRKTLGIPNYYAIILNVILGYPLHSAPIPSRKDVNLGLTIVD